MNIITIYKKFPTDLDCINILKVSVGKIKLLVFIAEAHTGTDNVKGVETRSGRRFQCQDCKKRIATRRLARDLDAYKKTAWSVGIRIRKAFKAEEKNF